jgi:hypothetical protein
MSTISSSTTSTTAYKVTADTTGTLVFQTGATPTTALTIGTDQSVTFAGTLTNSAGTANGVAYLNGSKVLTTGTALVFDGTNFGLTLSQNAATKATLTNSNVGASASARYEASNGSNTAEFGIRGSAQTTNGVLAPQVGYVYSPSAAGLALVSASGPILFSAGGTTESMRLDSSGRLLVGSSIFGNGCTTATANLPSNAGINSINNGSTVAFNFGIPTTTTNSNLGNFFNGNGTVGSITVNGSATSYNTSSDYRLKNITGPLTGAKDFIMALKPKQGTWKVDGSAFVGFLAHEFQEVSPSSVSGEKDAVDVDGKPIMQAMQASSSEVIANLVSFIQELKAEVDSLKAQINGASA